MQPSADSNTAVTIPTFKTILELTNPRIPELIFRYFKLTGLGCSGQLEVVDSGRVWRQGDGGALQLDGQQPAVGAVEGDALDGLAFRVDVHISARGVGVDTQILNFEI